MSLPAKSAAICLGIAVLDFFLIGLPGPCSFSGAFGDSLAHLPEGFFLAYGLVVLPILGVFLSGIWWIADAVVRLINRA